ncbi:MAG TPA: tRNA preQ1(34) S-adenosylmethionine ribosyltransferase-isomerase QueA [Verrucomicrobiae bacterium]|nr:tRNA preQ1(34) S-adenosylmethionine ribosyltransferase-isomerase QueA [Verrucomicrobiae bacterium]
MRASDFDYELPEELIAQTPSGRRDQSRMLVLHRATGKIEHMRFSDLPIYMRPGDVMVFNDSKVIPARLRTAIPEMEMLLVEEVAPNDWWVMMRPAKRARIGTVIALKENVCASVIDTNAEGHRRVKFSGVTNILDVLPQIGEIPLPPYIKRRAQSGDVERYQTVFARHSGSVAAPTAGLHFTPGVLDRLRERGVQIGFVTLHVGLGTFAPVKVENLEEHTMHEERFSVPVETATAVGSAKRVIAVGTTTVRVLESTLAKAGEGRTEIFIHAPFEFRVVDALLTNFHLPRSTLLMLVSAFAGRELVLTAYAAAVGERYRFFSYGDAMLIL